MCPKLFLEERETLLFPNVSCIGANLKFVDLQN
jgi:hypothetical protein